MEIQESNVKLYEACKYGNLDEFMYLLQSNKNLRYFDANYTLRLSCEFGQIEIANKCIELGAYDFNSCLNIASIHGHTKLVNKMIKFGANNFNDALDGALLFNHMDIVEVLLKSGATFDTFQKNKYEKWIMLKKNVREIFSEFLILDISNIIIEYFHNGHPLYEFSS